MNKRFKQITQASLALVLAFPATLLSAGTVLAESNNDNAEIETIEIPEEFSSPNEAEEQVLIEEDAKDIESQEFADNDTVRVIVEVEGTSGLTYATGEGVHYATLSEDVKEEIENDALDVQETVQSRINSANISAEVLESFTTVVNGFSAEVPYGQLERLESLDGVLSVEIVNEYERPDVEEVDMVNSVNQVRGPQTWEEYKVLGEKMVVGIIDTGIDPSHRDMILSEGVDSSLNESSLDGLDLPGKYFSEKVPYGYNYFDKNEEILETGNTSSQHGMHVAGTVAANGDIENGGIKGVAPEAQLLALKVFGNDPALSTTYGDIYVAAMDDAVKLGVDVLNLSLGSTAGFVNPNAHEQRAVQRMKENGIVVAISSGNSSHFGNGFGNPLASNPDIGVVGAPSVANASLSVASSDNNFRTSTIFSWTAGDANNTAAYLAADNPPEDVFDGEVEFVYGGYGTPEELASANVAGKVVVVSRGMFAGGDSFYANFIEKAKAAQRAGATGVVVHNNNDSGFVSMQSDNEVTIPFLFILQDSGLAIRDALAAGETVTASFDGKRVSTPAPIEGKLSDFSSWGLTPDLDFKPEITAPGGDILSTQQNNKYSIMSGTSMAAPHVSGGSALVLENLDESMNLTGAERSHVAKQILMNTAVPLKDKGVANTNLKLDNYYSPRGQGAGQMDLYSALSTSAWVSSPEDDNEGKVALRDFEDFVDFQLEIENFGDEELLYLVETSTQTDLVSNGKLDVAPNLQAAALTDLEVTAPEYVTVPAGQTVTVDIAMDLSNAKVEYLSGQDTVSKTDPDELFENGYFVEGFVEFVDPLDNQPTLSVPYVGFNGDWGALPTVDPEASTGKSFYGETDLYYTQTLNNQVGYYNRAPMNIPALGENTRLYGRNMETLVPVISLLRNAKEAQFNILNTDGEKVRTLSNLKDLRKNYYDRGQGSAYQIMSSAAWDGMLDGEVAPDSKYQYEIRTRPDYEGAEWQSYKFDFHLDQTAPLIETEFDRDAGVVSWNAKDDYSGLQGVEVIVNGQFYRSFNAKGSLNQVDSIELPDNTNRVQVLAIDYAGNITEEMVNVKDYQEHNDILVSITTPELLAPFNTYEVPITGFVESNTDIDKVTAMGQEMAVTYDVTNNRYAYEGVVRVEQDDVYDIQVVATSTDGEEASTNRQIVVDTSAPTITHNAPKETQQSEVEIDFNVKDNFDEIRFYLGDDEIYMNDFESPYERRDLDETITQTVSLSEGLNEFEIRAVDIAGNQTIETMAVTYNPAYESIARISGENRFATAVSISQKGWTSSDTVFIANGLQFADALAGVPLADQMDAPILLSRSDKLDSVVTDEIKRLGATNAVILGGPNTVSPDVEAALSSLGLSVERLAGETRFDTAIEIANKLNEGTESNVAVLANGLQFADALSVAPFAANDDMPIYLTRGKELEKELVETLNSYDQVYVIGGPNAVPSKATDALNTNVTRLAGETRYSTNVKVFETFGVESDRLYVATGAEFADALTGSVLAAKEGSGVALVRGELKGEFDTLMNNHQFTDFTLFGGLNAVSEIVATQLGEY